MARVLPVGTQSDGDESRHGTMPVTSGSLSDAAVANDTDTSAMNTSAGAAHANGGGALVAKTQKANLTTCFSTPRPFVCVCVCPAFVCVCRLDMSV